MIDRWRPEHRAQLHYEVATLVNAYARGVDRADWRAVRATYHDDALDDHGSTVGTPDEFIAALRARQTHVRDVMHLNANLLLLEVDEERREVLAESYCVSWQRLSADAPEIPLLYETPLIASDTKSRLCMVGNRYLDVVSERGGELRFWYRNVIYDWIQVTEHPGVVPFKAEWRTGSRDASDPSRMSLAELRRLRAGSSADRAGEQP